jgi:hypothetical protein
MKSAPVKNNRFHFAKDIMKFMFGKYKYKDGHETVYFLVNHESYSKVSPRDNMSAHRFHSPSKCSIVYLFGAIFDARRISFPLLYSFKFSSVAKILIKFLWSTNIFLLGCGSIKR